MKTMTITGISSKELGRKLLCEGYTAKVDCTNFWDSHGKRIDCAPTQYKFDSQKKFEIYEITGETTYSTIDYVHQWTYWDLYIDGKKLDVGEIMSYKILKTKIKLDVCVGAG